MITETQIISRKYEKQQQTFVVIIKCTTNYLTAMIISVTIMTANQLASPTFRWLTSTRNLAFEGPMWTKGICHTEDNNFPDVGGLFLNHRIISPFEGRWREWISRFFSSFFLSFVRVSTCDDLFWMKEIRNTWMTFEIPIRMKMWTKIATAYKSSLYQALYSW